jgi:hypothetical protein
LFLLLLLLLLLLLWASRKPTSFSVSTAPNLLSVLVLTPRKSLDSGLYLAPVSTKAPHVRYLTPRKVDSTHGICALDSPARRSRKSSRDSMEVGGAWGVEWY